jgi:hypothetical protein
VRAKRWTAGEELLVFSPAAFRSPDATRVGNAVDHVVVEHLERQLSSAC